MEGHGDARPHTSYTAVLETLDAPETVLAGTTVTGALGGTAAAVAAVYKSMPLAPAVILGGARSSLFGFTFFSIRSFMAAPGRLYWELNYPSSFPSALSYQRDDRWLKSLPESALAGTMTWLLLKYRQPRIGRAALAIGGLCGLTQLGVNGMGIARLWLLSGDLPAPDRPIRAAPAPTEVTPPPTSTWQAFKRVMRDALPRWENDDEAAERLRADIDRLDGQHAALVRALEELKEQARRQ